MDSGIFFEVSYVSVISRRLNFEYSGIEQVFYEKDLWIAVVILFLSTFGIVPLQSITLASDIENM